MTDNGKLDMADIVMAGNVFKAERNANSWNWGDLICVAFSEQVIKAGRPLADSDEPTLSALADAWDEPLPKLSALHLTADFYKPNVRMSELSWSHHDLARRHSDGQVDNALELLGTALGAHFSVKTFRMYLSGDYFEGPIDSKDLPEWMWSIIPRNQKHVWIKVKRFQEEVE